MNKSNKHKCPGFLCYIYKSICLNVYSLHNLHLSVFFFYLHTLQWCNPCFAEQKCDFFCYFWLNCRRFLQALFSRCWGGWGDPAWSVNNLSGFRWKVHRSADQSQGKKQHLPSTFIYHTFLISLVWVFCYIIFCDGWKVGDSSALAIKTNRRSRKKGGRLRRPRANQEHCEWKVIATNRSVEKEKDEKQRVELNWKEERKYRTLLAGALAKSDIRQSVSYWRRRLSLITTWDRLHC